MISIKQYNIIRKCGVIVQFIILNYRFYVSYIKINNYVTSIFFYKNIIIKHSILVIQKLF